MELSGSQLAVTVCVAPGGNRGIIISLSWFSATVFSSESL